MNRQQVQVENPMVLTMLRQAILPVLLALLLRSLNSLPLIWTAFFAAELLCIPGALFLWQRKQKRVLAVI